MTDKEVPLVLYDPWWAEPFALWPDKKERLPAKKCTMTVPSLLYLDAEDPVS